MIQIGKYFLINYLIYKRIEKELSKCLNFLLKFWQIQLYRKNKKMKKKFSSQKEAEFYQHEFYQQKKVWVFQMIKKYSIELI